MRQRVARTSRYLAGLVNQQAARTNAAEGSAVLRRRRQDQEDVEEYLQGRFPTVPAAGSRTGERGAHQVASDL